MPQGRYLRGLSVGLRTEVERQTSAQPIFRLMFWTKTSVGQNLQCLFYIGFRLKLYLNGNVGWRKAR